MDKKDLGGVRATAAPQPAGGASHLSPQAVSAEGAHDPLVQSFAQFEQLLRSKVIDEAAGVLKRARDEIERLEYPYIGESAASVIADIDASIRQLGERGRHEA